MSPTEDAGVAGIVLSAGLGTRLGDLGLQRPKALFPLCNVPLARWALSLLRYHGINDVTFNLHHLGSLIREELAPQAAAGAHLRFSEEQELLGTGGGVKAMSALAPPRTAVVVNGKLAVNVDLHAVLAQHRDRGAVATMVLYPRENAAAWGAIGIDSEGRVSRILEAQRPGGSVADELMFTGIHVIEPELVSAIPDGPCCIIRTAYETLLRAGARIDAFVHRGYFYEHSTPARYLQGNFNLLSGEVELPSAPGPVAGIDLRAEVADGARIVPPVLLGAVRVASGARVGPYVVAGDGATVAQGVQVSNSVIWPGGQLNRSVTRAIVSRQQLIRVEACGDPMSVPR